MKSMRMLVMVIVLGTLLVPISCAQEKHKASEDSKSLTPLRVQVVLSEFEGEKKISTLPYTFFVDAEEGHLGALTSLRMGLRIPVALGTKDSSSEIQYMDVGMEVDCNAAAMEDGRFKIALAVRRSSIYPPGAGKGTLSEAPSDLPASTRPILRQFSAAVHLLVRDGQTVQSTAAADPVSGRVLKTELTATVAK